MKFIKQVILLLGFSLYALTSCNPDVIEAKNEKEIKKYLKDNNLQAESTSSGLYYIITVPGSSEHPTISDTVTISYTGTLLNGEEFDSSPSSNFPLLQLIDGMQEGIQLFGKGGEGTIIIPSELGYGGYPPPGIPVNAVLVFDIKLIDF